MNNLITRWVAACVLVMVLASCIDYKLYGEAVEFYFPEEILDLINTAERGDVEQVSRLVANGIDVNHVGIEGVTPLIWMLGSRNKEGMHALLKNGASPNLASFHGDSALTLAAQFCDDDFLRILLDYKADPDAFGKEGETALLLSISYHCWDNMRLLVEGGADVNKPSMGGELLPVMHAAFQGDYEHVHFLLDAGADYKLKSRFGLDLTYTISLPPGDGTVWKEKVIKDLQKKGAVIPESRVK